MAWTAVWAIQRLSTFLPETRRVCQGCPHRGRSFHPWRNWLFLVSVRQFAIIHAGQFTVDFTLVSNQNIPFFRSLKGWEIKRFQQGCIAWKYTALAVQATVGGVQALNCICCVNYRTYVRRELEDRTDCISVVIPAFHRTWIFLFPGGCNLIRWYSLHDPQCFSISLSLIKGAYHESFPHQAAFSCWSW